MKKLFYYIGSIVLLISISCDRNYPDPDQFFSATINGEEFQASYLYALRQDNDHLRSVELIASNMDVIDSTFSYGELESSDDFKLFFFSFRQDCITEKLFTRDDMNTDTSCVGCVYEFFDSSLKAILPQFLYSDGFIEVESVDFEENGIISGNFKITGRNYIELEFTDTIKVENGKFRLKFKN